MRVERGRGEIDSWPVPCTAAGSLDQFQTSRHLLLHGNGSTQNTHLPSSLAMKLHSLLFSPSSYELNPECLDFILPQKLLSCKTSSCLKLPVFCSRILNWNFNWHHFFCHIVVKLQLASSGENRRTQLKPQPNPKSMGTFSHTREIMKITRSFLEWHAPIDTWWQSL